LTVTDKQTIRKKLKSQKYTHKHNTNERKQQLNIQQKQNYPDSVASYDTQPGNELGLFYNGPSTTACTSVIAHKNLIAFSNAL